MSPASIPHPVPSSSPAPHLPVPTVPVYGPSQPASNTAPSPFRAENPGPFSPQATNVQAPSHPSPPVAQQMPTAAATIPTPSPHVPPSSGAPYGLTPLNSNGPPAQPSSPGKKKKTFLQKIGLKKKPKQDR
ncbi:hypothetical protein NP233_g10127 [Leucocoprinus birnbaumii]|uniref:Uncharacterized protein n=1 Tax=Leucocoprinus birnbaumii TaxID=56174 RepID=A0AAD5VJK4_9AGAR|nr:hypothetical protein NP233_g10127 [Leucocoprinus birnbaumii]